MADDEAAKPEINALYEELDGRKGWKNKPAKDLRELCVRAKQTAVAVNIFDGIDLTTVRSKLMVEKLEKYKTAAKKWRKDHGGQSEDQEEQEQEEEQEHDGENGEQEEGAEGQPIEVVSQNLVDTDDSPSAPAQTVPKKRPFVIRDDSDDDGPASAPAAMHAAVPASFAISSSGKRWLKWAGSSLPPELVATGLKFESSKWLQVDLKEEKQVFDNLSADGKLGGAGFETVKATWGKSAIKVLGWRDASGAAHSMSFAHDTVYKQQTQAGNAADTVRRRSARRCRTPSSAYFALTPCHPPSSCAERQQRAASREKAQALTRRAGRCCTRSCARACTRSCARRARASSARANPARARTCARARTRARARTSARTSARTRRARASSARANPARAAADTDYRRTRQPASTAQPNHVPRARRQRRSGVLALQCPLLCV